MTDDDCQEFDLNAFIGQVAYLMHWYQQNEVENPKALWNIFSPRENDLNIVPFKDVKHYVYNVLDLKTKQSVEQNFELSIEAQTLFKAGRLLVMFADASFADATAEIMSKGFFNWDDYAPPITWLAWIEEKPSVSSVYLPYILSWIPPQFVDSVTEGISMCPSESILYLSDWDIESCCKQVLKAHQLLI